MSDQPSDPGSRKLALGMLAGSLLILGVHHVASDQGVWPMALLFAPMIGALGLGGLIDPRICVAIGPAGDRLPGSVKAVGFGFALGGLICGGLLAHFVYGLWR